MSFPVEPTDLDELLQFLSDRYHDLEVAALCASRMEATVAVAARDGLRTDVREAVVTHFDSYVTATPPIVIASVARSASAGLIPRFDIMRRDIATGRWSAAWAHWVGACRESCAFEDHPAWQETWGEVTDNAAAVEEAEDAAWLGLFTGEPDDR